MINQFKEENIIREGHFLLSSGRHSELYIDKDRIYRSKLFPSVIASLAWACKLFDLQNIDILTGPAIAGAVLAAPVYYEVQRQLYGKPMNFVYPEKIMDEMTFRRGYDEFLDKKKVLLIEDIITTGNSVMKTAKSVYSCGGIVKGVVCIWNRTAWQSKYFKTISLIDEIVPSWEPKECPLCYLNEIPLTNPKE